MSDARMPVPIVVRQATSEPDVTMIITTPPFTSAPSEISFEHATYGWLVRVLLVRISDDTSSIDLRSRGPEQFPDEVRATMRNLQTRLLASVMMRLDPNRPLSPPLLEVKEEPHE